MEHSIPGASPRNWKLECEAAERETEPTKLRALLEQIEAAMFTRLQELGTTETQERGAIANAAKIVRRLQVERLNFPKAEIEEN
jgi:hypothetical protein